MRIFRNPGETPVVDQQRFAADLARLAERERQFDETVKRLVAENPGNPEIIAAAGIAYCAQRGTSMIELGAAAVDALRRAGYLPALYPGVATVPHVDASLPAPETRVSARDDIPDDWETG